jgi:integration host factor subunit beta
VIDADLQQKLTQEHIMATTSKKDLVNRIAESTGLRQVLVKTVVQQFFDEVIAELVRGNRLEFRDFGVFEPKTTPARTAQNPRTLEKVEVPAKRRVVFKPGRLMKEELSASQCFTHSAPSSAEPTLASNRGLELKGDVR